MYKPKPISSSLLITPSFFAGTTRIGDMFGQLNTYNYSKTGYDSDRKALSRDWKIVGKEISKAITNFKKNAK